MDRCDEINRYALQRAEEQLRSDEKRLERNEKRRRRTALAFACRFLPIELEREIFSYMKDPDNGRIDVSMKWQIHPIAKMIPFFLKWGKPLPRRIIESMSRAMSDCDMWRFQCHWHFTMNMQRKIANKAFEIAFQGNSDPSTEKVIKMQELLEWRKELNCTITKPWEQQLRDV